MCSDGVSLVWASVRDRHLSALAPRGSRNPVQIGANTALIATSYALRDEIGRRDL